MFQKLALLATMRRRQRRHHPGAMDLATTSVARRAFAPQTAPPSIVPNSNLPGTILSVQVLRFVAALSVVSFHAHNALVSQLPGHASDMIDHAFKVGATGFMSFS